MKSTKHNRLDYLYNKRMAIIQKANTPLQVRIQMIGNRAIDEYIYYLNDDLENYSITPYFNPEIFGKDILNLNIASTNAAMQRLLDKGIITQNSITKMESLIASENIARTITKAEIDRINKNLQFIEKTLDEADLAIGTYKHLIDKLPQTVSRKDILDKALETGSNYKGREYSYKELDRLSRDLEKYKDSHARYETGMIENRQASREGLPAPNTMKIWVWSELEDTRHHDMSGQTVRFGEKFEVVNEKTGVTDYLRFPHDIENDTNNGANTINCACSYLIK